MDWKLEVARREAVFSWLHRRLAHTDVLSWSELVRGVDFHGRRQPLMHAQRGIYVPAGSDVALSLKTSLDDPYGDEFAGDTSILYSMAQDGPGTRDNESVLRAMHSALPVVYVRQVSDVPPARYAVVHPVWVIAHDTVTRTFRIEATPATSATTWIDLEGAGRTREASSYSSEIVRAYSLRRTKARLHQAAFRERVLDAYGSRCALCRLGHAELLDAAHITPDADEAGDPVVTNGLCLCRLHHGAFDLSFWAAEPDTLRVRVAKKILAETDGPMLRHGLQALDGAQLHPPRRTSDRPDRARLARRWSSFLATG